MLKKWEYKVEIDVPLKGVAELGEEGWELAAIEVLDAVHLSVFYFKRELTAEPEPTKLVKKLESSTHAASEFEKFGKLGKLEKEKIIEEWMEFTKK